MICPSKLLHRADSFPASSVNKVFSARRAALISLEISTLSIQKPATAVITANGETVMATAKFGKGRVFAVGDPWLYNEYVDGRKLPAEYENFRAAQDLSRWLIAQAKRK